MHYYYYWCASQVLASFGEFIFVAYYSVIEFVIVVACFSIIKFIMHGLKLEDQSPAYN